MTHCITILPAKLNIEVTHGANLLELLRSKGLATDAPCGGNGSCGKCKVLVEGREVLACQTVIDRDMTVTLIDREKAVRPSGGDGAAVSSDDDSTSSVLWKTHRILAEGISAECAVEPLNAGYLLALDIGTTTVVGYLLEGKSGRELASESRLNPQTAFGADVISRIQVAMKGQQEALTGCIRECVEEITRALCAKAGIKPEQIGVICPVGNPAMQQLFLGISPRNLAQIPFAPVLTEAKTVPAGEYLSCCREADLIIVPDISGFVGADTLACVLATGLDSDEEITLLVDIGTNGEMVLGNKERMVACSTAAGPALEGANIQFGMRGMLGAIDHVWIEAGKIQCSVINEKDLSEDKEKYTSGRNAGKRIEPIGICGSGLIDAVAAAFDMGLINDRGRVQTEDRCIHLTDKIYLTQEDIREVQMAKGAIAAGIKLMAEQLGLALEDIDRVYLAGAFGSFMDPDSACRIGLLPPVLRDKITAVGNAAGNGAKMIACSKAEIDHAQQLTQQIEFIELAALPGFQRCFAENMRF